MNEKRIEVERKCDDTYSIAGYAKTYSAREVLDDYPDRFTIIYDDDPQGKQDEPREARLQRLWDELDAKDALKSIADHAERIAAMEAGLTNYNCSTCHDAYCCHAGNRINGICQHYKHYNEPPAPAEPKVDLDALKAEIYEHVIPAYDIKDRRSRLDRIFADFKEASRE